MRQVRIAIAGAVAVLVVASAAVAGAPTEQVRQYTDQVQKILDVPAVPLEQ